MKKMCVQIDDEGKEWALGGFFFSSLSDLTDYVQEITKKNE
jgi:hypothetical protein